MKEKKSTQKTGSFFAQVYKLVGQIPCGKVASYGQLAWMLGVPRGARQVGWALRCCPDDLPWQRVVRDDGQIAGGFYADVRRMLLKGEGISFLPDGRVDMEKHRWHPEQQEDLRS